MTHTKQRITFVALTALLALFAGCKGESPTAPPPITGTSGGGTGTGGSGGTPPPTGSTVTLTASSATPLTNSTSTITATVTNNGTAVPNGTAVEFSTTSQNATFTDTPDNPKTLIRTTTNGVATATVTSTTAGVVTVTATVNNVAKSINVTFQDPVIPVIPPPTNPTITAVTPAIGLPTGNQTITITGTNFKAPVRVLFDPGNGQTPKEAFVTNVTPTQITVITPAFDLGSGQQQAVSIILITEAGLPTEQRVVRAAAFTYQAAVLTPVVRAISPTSGPIEGGTRVTIIGDAFEAPAQVFFGSAQAQVLTVDFHQIVVIAPTARDTNPNGSGTVTGPIDVRVLNVNSGKSTTATAAFRYIAKMQITAINPRVGSALGGTDITIDGVGFNDPVTVDVGGVRASVLRVSGTQILVRTGPLASPCAADAAASLPVTVTNVDNGDTATSAAPQTFTYIGVPSVITSVGGSSPTVPGTSLTVVVQNPGVGLLGTASVGFTVGSTPTTATPQTISGGSGPQNFSVLIPSGLTFNSVACTANGITGTQFVPTAFPITFTNITTACTATVANAITIAPPPASAGCVTPPTASFPASCVPANPTVVAAGAAAQTATFTISNLGSQSLTLTAPTATATNATIVSITPSAPQTVTGGNSQSYTITLDPTAAGATGATITFTTNDPANPTLTITVCGNAT